jgi:extradiol dioxygenase family protein
LIVEDDLQVVKAELEAKGIKHLTDIVVRHGSRGLMRSLYVRDPDGNLVELSCY